MRLPFISFIAAICLTHILTMLGFSAFPALLPDFSRLWSLSSTQAGAINSALFVGYVCTVPFLVSLTDRVDALKIYVSSAILGGLAHLGFAYFAHDALSAGFFMCLYGISLAGTYMPGLAILGAHLPASAQARATGFYTASFGLGAALSYVLADFVSAQFGWQAVFIAGAGASFLATTIIVSASRPCPPPETPRPWKKLLDPRPVFSNRSAMGYALCYGLHSYELFTVRAWLVAFLTATLINGAAYDIWSPAMIAAAMTLLGVFASVGGNEWAIRTGRRRAIAIAMVTSGTIAIMVAGASMISYMLCAGLVLLHGVLIMLDSAALTAGAFGAARAHERGLTMAVHSTLGFGGAMIGPFVFGLIADGFNNSALGWALAYGHLALIVFAGPIVMRYFAPQALAGDHRS